MVVVAAAVAVACGPAGVRYRVVRGDNLYRIGKAYGVSVAELARANTILDPSRIEIGQVLVIPHATRQLPVQMITPERARADFPSAADLPPGRHPFAWPASGVLSSGFGPRGESHHDGIDISCPAGTPVRAARGGRVLYSDMLRGYGNLLIVEHDAGWVTVYAHNRENRARSGDAVRQGDVIAVVGESGNTSGPNLHFEVRKDNVAHDPLFFLPPTPVAGAAKDATTVVQSGS
jgi:murein DD-endopeptidase MepM/ murein hydrolase activator NlpD